MMQEVHGCEVGGMSRTLYCRKQPKTGGERDGWYWPPKRKRSPRQQGNLSTKEGLAAKIITIQTSVEQAHAGKLKYKFFFSFQEGIPDDLAFDRHPFSGFSHADFRVPTRLSVWPTYVPIYPHHLPCGAHRISSFSLRWILEPFENPTLLLRTRTIDGLSTA